MRLRFVLPIFAPLLLSGCFLQVRSLKTENRMLEARVEQLTQDLEASQAGAPPPPAELADFQRQLHEKDASIALLRTKVDGLQRELDAAKEEPLAVKKSDASADSPGIESYAALQKQAEEYGAQLSSKELQIADLNMRIHELEGEKNDLRMEMSKAGDDASEGERAIREELQKVRLASTESETKLADAVQRAKTAEGERDALRAEAESLRAKAEAAPKPDASMPDPQRLARINQSAREVLSSFVKSGEVAVRSTERAVVVTIQADALFQPASTTVSDAGLKILTSLKDTLSASQAPAIRVVGHTDDQPLGKRLNMYADNWDLAAARASAVVRWLATQPGLKPEQLHSVSRSYAEPVATNGDANGRRRNRRVEVWIEWSTPTKPAE